MRTLRKLCLVLVVLAMAAFAADNTLEPGSSTPANRSWQLIRLHSKR
jgi:hypothetical protein